ncbi:hypothetical protein GCM10028862_08670 [Luteimonas pelagia]
MNVAPSDFERSHAAVCALIERFELYAETSYLQPHYQEAEVRKDFIDPLLKALGWDVDHEREHNPYEQEVKVERGVQMARAQKRADYAFYVKPNFRDVRFFVEAKKPSVDLDRSVDAHFQTLRYGYSANTPLAVLTDFEQVRVLDCRRRPNPDSALDQTWKSWHYTSFRNPRIFAEFYWLFSREAHTDGSYERRVAELPKPKGGAKQRGLFRGGYQPVDESFLSELEEFRVLLAKAFKTADRTLTSSQLTEMVQRTLDRLVFLRFLEDKQIETEIRVGDLGKRKDAWADFQEASRRLDSIYNGIVFKNATILDNQTFKVDPEIFGEVCERLASENSPYNFDAIPIHILGSIYERFLGSVIVASEDAALVEEKPEVRKAGGVFYTPEYIVRYIVEQTVGEKIRGKRPADISSLTFADIACGSGSFLLGIFTELLRYHADWYNQPANTKQAKRDGCVRTEDERWALSLAQRRAILQNNVFGVDLDRQAVEVAQLSLFLKLLEDERATSARQYQLDYARNSRLRKLLPDLTANVVCGNSLIDWDQCAAGKISTDLERQLNPLDLGLAFPQVFENGGFDAIVGNPPYVRPHNVDAHVKDLLWQAYETYTKKADIYCCFVERATELLRSEGRLSYILSKGWMQLDSFQALRSHLLNNYQIVQLVSLPFRVFQDAQVDTAIFVATREPHALPRDETRIQLVTAEQVGLHVDFTTTNAIPQREFSRTFNNVFDLSITPESAAIKMKVARGPKLREVFDISFGIKTGDDEKFLHREEGRYLEDKKLLRGGDVFRYGYEHTGEYVRYAPSMMRAHRSTARPGTSQRYEQPKVLVKDTTTDFGAALDVDNHYVKDVLVVASKTKNSGYSLELLLALLNSKLMRYFYRTTFPTLHVQSGELGSLPLPLLDSADKRGLAAKIAYEAVQLSSTVAKARCAESSADQEFFERKCSALDRRIDGLVYELYELDTAESAAIEHWSAA